MPDKRRATSAPDVGSVERLVAMRSFPGAVELHANELSVLASVARPRRLGRGEVLAREGHVVPAIFVVIEGEVVVRRSGQTIERAGPGTAVGVLYALSRDPRGLDCHAGEGALVLQIAIDDLEDVFEELPIVLVRMVGHVARRALALGLLRASGGSASPPPRTPLASAPSLPTRPLDLVERILFLRRCGAFQGASIDAVAALANIAGEVRVAAGDPLWRRGDAAGSLFVVVAGELEVTLAGGAGITLRAGDLAGENELLAGEPHPSDALARGSVVALAIERDALLDSWEDHTDLGVELLREASTALLALPGAGD